MSDKRSIRAILGPAAATLVMLAVLVGLGCWQLRRLGEKQALLDQIALAEQSPPTPLPDAPRPFEKVSVSGRWLPQLARYGAEVRDTPQGPRMGSELLGVLQRPEVPAVLVDLGWVDDAERVSLPHTPATVVGFVRRPDRASWLSAHDDVAGARFFTLDPGAIAAALGVEVAPFTVVALQGVGELAPGVRPAPTGSLPRPLNNHLSYALTWFGLAATLVVVFGLWLRQGIRV